MAHGIRGLGGLANREMEPCIGRYPGQNRYVGDIGDFGKYGLLCAPAQEEPLSPGVNWRLFPDECYHDVRGGPAT